MARQLFKAGQADPLKRLANREYSSSEERDQLLATVLQTPGLQPRDVVWMLFQPDRAVRQAGLSLLGKQGAVDTVDLVLQSCQGKPDAALRAAATSLFQLKIPGTEARLVHYLTEGADAMKEAARRIVLEAPPSPEIAPALWRLFISARGRERLLFLDRLAGMELDSGSLARWQALVHDDDRQVREKALVLLAQKAPAESVDMFVDALQRSSYTTQQHLALALANAAQGRGPEFIDQVLPLMAAGDASARSVVLQILLGMDDRAEVVKRYVAFSKGLAGWVRDRALDSMKDFGDELLDPMLSLMCDPDEEIRATALVVASSFKDRRILPATMQLLEDPDWWIRVTAADILGQLGDANAAPALVAALDDPELIWAAVEALGRIGDPQSLPALSRLLSDAAPEVRIEVLLALRNFKHPQVLEVLQQVARTDPHRAVRSRALEIAEELAARDKAQIEDPRGLRAAALEAQLEAGEPPLDTLLIATRNHGASDLHLSVSRPPMVRIAAELRAMTGEPYTAEQTGSMLRDILTDEQWQRLEAERQLDFCYHLPKAGRYRGNVFLDQKGLNAVFRVIPEKPPTMSEVGLPAQLAEIADYHQGLVLVCGPAGSGKSTTLAALVNLFNDTRHHHIITLEDPVEFVHPFKNCLINQREVGAHTQSYARALRGALREDPDVIVIGDLRDNETVELALTAAETGHIVLGTLNSTSATKAIDRVVSSFPSDEQGQIRTAVSESLKYVIAQRLLPAVEVHRQVACFEILRVTRSIANLIRDEKTFQIPSMMQLGRSQGMQPFDEALRRLLNERRITPENAYLAATKKEDFEALVSAEFLESGSFL